MPMFGQNTGIYCHLADDPGKPDWTWWRDSNPRALLCRQLPGLLGTPRAVDTRGRDQACPTFIAQAFAGRRSLSSGYAVLPLVAVNDARLSSPVTPAATTRVRMAAAMWV